MAICQMTYDLLNALLIICTLQCFHIPHQFLWELFYICISLPQQGIMLDLWFFSVLTQRLDLILDVFSNINDSMILYVKGNKHEVGCSFKGNTWGEGWRGQRINHFDHMNTDSAVERMHKNTSLTRRISPWFCSQCLFCGKQMYGFLCLKISSNIKNARLLIDNSYLMQIALSCLDFWNADLHYINSQWNKKFLVTCLLQTAYATLCGQKSDRNHVLSLAWRLLVQEFKAKVLLDYLCI